MGIRVRVGSDRSDDVRGSRVERSGRYLGAARSKSRPDISDDLIRRSRQVVRAHPPASGLSVKPREIVRAVALVPTGGAVSVAVSPAHDFFFPKHGR